MTGSELAIGLQSAQQEAMGLKGVVAAYQAGLPVNTMIGSAALVSGVLAAVGFGAKYKLAADLAELARYCDDFAAALRADEDEALKLGDADVTEALALRANAHIQGVQVLEQRVRAIGGRVDQFAGAAEIAETPARVVVDTLEDARDKAGGLVDTLSWWAKWGTTVIVVVVLALLALLFFSPTGKSLVGRVTGGSK